MSVVHFFPDLHKQQLYGHVVPYNLKEMIGKLIASLSLNFLDSVHSWWSSMNRCT